MVDDESKLRDVLKVCLERDGYRVLEANDGKAGLEMALAERPDLVILDVMLPGMDGLAVCGELRRREFSGAILMLTTLAEVEHRVEGLEQGADDYLPKPFDLQELAARIRALLRRRPAAERRASLLRFGPVEVDLEGRRARSGSTPLNLTPTEYALLELLARNVGRTVSRRHILEAVWGYTFLPATRTVDTHIYRLRRKIGDDAAEPKWIRKIRGEGYSLAEEALGDPG